MERVLLESVDSFQQRRINRLVEKIESEIKEMRVKNFSDYFVNVAESLKHIEKRLRLGHITSITDYIRKIQDSILNPEEVVLGVYSEQQKRNEWLDRLHFLKGDWVSVVLLMESGEWKLVTAYKLYKDFWDEIIGRKGFEMVIRVK